MPRLYLLQLVTWSHESLVLVARLVSLWKVTILSNHGYSAWKTVDSDGSLLRTKRKCYSRLSEFPVRGQNLVGIWALIQTCGWGLINGYHYTCVRLRCFTCPNYFWLRRRIAVDLLSYSRYIASRSTLIWLDRKKIERLLSFCSCWNTCFLKINQKMFRFFRDICNRTAGKV